MEPSTSRFSLEKFNETAGEYLTHPAHDKKIGIAVIKNLGWVASWLFVAFAWGAGRVTQKSFDCGKWCMKKISKQHDTTVIKVSDTRIVKELSNNPQAPKALNREGTTAQQGAISGGQDPMSNKLALPIKTESDIPATNSLEIYAIFKKYQLSRPDEISKVQESEKEKDMNIVMEYLEKGQLDDRYDIIGHLGVWRDSRFDQMITKVSDEYYEQGSPGLISKIMGNPSDRDAEKVAWSKALGAANYLSTLEKIDIQLNKLFDQHFNAERWEECKKIISSISDSKRKEKLKARLPQAK